MKLRNIIAKCYFIIISTTIIACSVCKDITIKSYEKDNSVDYTPQPLDAIYEKEDYSLSELGVSSDYFRRKYKKTNDGQIISKRDTLFDTDKDGKTFVYKTYPERPYSAFLIGNSENGAKDIHTTIDDGFLLEKYIQIERAEKYMDTIKTINVEVCSNNFHGKFSVTDKNDKKLYTTKFKNGSGYWKDFFYHRKTDHYTLKEEGILKNNFKFGEWKYYNKNGEIDSIKTYSIRDSVDIRFPHCIFNKNEPCY